MAKYDSWVKSYEIHPPVGGIYRWGARGVVYINKRELETGEFLGKTKEEAEEEAWKALKTKIKEQTKGETEKE